MVDVKIERMLVRSVSNRDLMVALGINPDKEDLYYVFVDSDGVEIIYNEITKNQQGNYSLRHPRFDKVRDDKEEADELI